MKKIGIMGGTFNPIHFGHLFLAENAYEQLGLDKILFMPSKNPPHKEKPDMITEQQRVDMIALAIRNNPHFEVSNFELEREGMTYTADTLTLLSKQNPDTEYYFIVGADSLFYMQQWWKPQIIFNLCTVVAASRDHADMEQLQKQADLLNSIFHGRIVLIDMPTIQIASAAIRERIASNRSIRYYLPDEVQQYIIEHRLYSAILEDVR